MILGGRGPRSPRQLSREWQQKTDNRSDHFASREQLAIVVIGVGKHEERLGSGRGIVEASTVLHGHDCIAPACDDQQRHSDPFNLIDRREAVPEKQAHRQERIVMLPHVGHRCERRSQNERCRRVLNGEADRHGCSQRLAEVHDPRRIDVGATGKIRSGGATICREPALRRRSGIAAVTTIVGEKNLQSVPVERRCQGSPVPSIAGVPVEHHNGDTRRRAGCRTDAVWLQ